MFGEDCTQMLLDRMKEKNKDNHVTIIWDGDGDEDGDGDNGK